MILVFLFKEAHLIKCYLLKDKKKIILCRVGICQVIDVYNAKIESYCEWEGEEEVTNYYEKGEWLKQFSDL